MVHYLLVFMVGFFLCTSQLVSANDHELSQSVLSKVEVEACYEEIMISISHRRTGDKLILIEYKGNPSEQWDCDTKRLFVTLLFKQIRFIYQNRGLTKERFPDANKVGKELLDHGFLFIAPLDKEQQTPTNYKQSEGFAGLVVFHIYNCIFDEYPKNINSAE